jgi:hypothetical protein
MSSDDTSRSSDADRLTYPEVFKSDTDRAVFLGHPSIDHLVTAVTALSAEVWSVRRRMKVLESVLEKQTAMTREMLELYVPTADEQAQWAADRDAMVRLVFDAFAQVGDTPYGSSLHPTFKDGAA